ncbi:MAG: GNAT family N-acetyltransferase [Ktedonobacterales bacterium]
MRALTDATASPGGTARIGHTEGAARAEPTIRRATLDDLDAVVAVADAVPHYQMGSPIYAPFTAAIMEASALRAEYAELLADPQVALWLALRAGRIVGYQLYLPEAAHDTKLLIPERCVELALGATLPGARAQGVGSVLTAHGLAWAHAAGYAVCLADWRTANPLSSRFWPRQGFDSVIYRLARRIDGHVAHTSAPARGE